MCFVHFLGEVTARQFCFEINWPLAKPLMLKSLSFLNKNVKSLGTVLVLPFGWTVHLRKWRLGFFYSTRYNLSHSWWNASQQPPGTCLSLTPPQKIREITNYVQLISWQKFYRHYCTYTKFWEYRSWAKSIFFGRVSFFILDYYLLSPSYLKSGIIM